MGFFSSLFERREFSLQKWENWLDSLSGGVAASTGITITEKSALTWTAVYACVMVKAQDVAKIPLPTYRRLGNYGEEGREPATEHYTWKLFRQAPNKYMSPFILRQTMQKHLEVSGNSFALIERDSSNIPVALWPRLPSQMAPEIINGKLFYAYTDANGRKQYYSASEVFHLRGLSNDGITGLSPLDLFRDSIGLGLAYQEHAARTFANQAKPPFVLKTPADIGPAKAREIADAFFKEYGGIQNVGKTAVLYGGMEPHALGFSNKDAEFIESRRFSVEECCRIWRVPPHKVMDFLRATFSNVTETNISYVVDTLMPIQVMWEESIQQQIMLPDDRAIYYVEHDNSALLKGTPRERAEVEEIYLRTGLSNHDEIRGTHNWKPIPGGKGKTHYQQAQMVPVGTLPAQEPTKQRSDEPVDMDLVLNQPQKVNGKAVQ